MWVMYVGYGLASEGLKGGLLQVGGAGTQYAFVIDYVFNFWNVLMFYIFISISAYVVMYFTHPRSWFYIWIVVRMEKKG